MFQTFTIYYHPPTYTFPTPGYSDTWPETGDPPPPWLPVRSQELPPARRPHHRRMPSTLPCRMRETRAPM